MLKYLDERKELCAIYERENYKAKSIIDDYEAGYRQLVDGILENPNDVAVIKANIAEIVSNYAWILKLNHRNLFYILLAKSALAIMCLLMNEKSRNYYLPIVVTAEDGTTKTYTIKVTKLATDEEKPGNLIDEELYLSSLSITGIELSPAFSKNVFSYTATLNDESVNEVTINAKANNSKAKVEITGNKNLVDGENTINIVLTLDGETEQVVYQVVLNKVVETEDEGVIETNIEGPTQYTNDSKIKLYILIPIVVVVLIIVAIVVLIILIVKENKRLDAEDKKYNKNDDTTSKAEEYNVFENDENEFKGQSVEYSSKDMLDNEDENPKPNKKKGKHS